MTTELFDPRVILAVVVDAIALLRSSWVGRRKRQKSICFGLFPRTRLDGAGRPDSNIIRVSLQNNLAGETTPADNAGRRVETVSLLHDIKGDFEKARTNTNGHFLLFNKQLLFTSINTINYHGARNKSIGIGRYNQRRK